MKRKKKKYARPRKPFESVRIADENEIVKKYGLKNKKEVWKSLAKVDYFRRRAMELAKCGEDEQRAFLNKLQNMGLRVNSIFDVLDLKINDLLERRLPTIIVKRGLANSEKQARQMVVHKRIIVDKNIINSPSYIVPISEEHTIVIKENRAKTKEIKSKNDKEDIGSNI